MPGYNPPDSKAIPFKFTKTGYAKPTYNPTDIDFHPEYSVSDLKAAIQVMGIYQESTYTYKKYCPTYVIGYSAYGVQILKGRCVYGGIRDLGARISIKGAEHGVADLSAFLKQLKASKVPFDLSAFIKVYEHLDLPSYIRGYAVSIINATIGSDLPRDLGGYINIFVSGQKDLSANVYGWQALNLNATLAGLLLKNLPSSLYPVPPKNLNAYLKVWPERYLYALIHGWNSLNLAAYIKGKPYADLSSYIGTHVWINLGSLVKGWVREAKRNLSAYIVAFQFRYLPAYIFSYEIKNLGGYIHSISPIRLPAKIHGWQEAYLTASLYGKDYPYQLKAYINGSGGFKDLIAYARPVVASKEFKNLPSSTYGWDKLDLKAYVFIDSYSVLSAKIFPAGFGNLPASIFPKMIRLTSILKMITLNNYDLSAMINVSCIFSKFSNLSAYISSVFKSDLGGYLRGIKDLTPVDLSASVGETLTRVVLDKLPLTIRIKSDAAKVYDILPVYFTLFNGISDMSANLTPIPMHTDLSAKVYSVYLRNYVFEHQKNKERVYKPSVADPNRLLLSKVVEFSLKDAVKEYVYLSTADKVFAAGFFDKWLLQATAYSPENLLTGKKRRLFRAAALHNLSKYRLIDDAVRSIIEFVTWEASSDLNAVINLNHKSMLAQLKAQIVPKYVKSAQTSIGAFILGQAPYSTVVGYDSDGIEIVN